MKFMKILHTPAFRRPIIRARARPHTPRASRYALGPLKRLDRASGYLQLYMLSVAGLVFGLPFPAPSTAPGQHPVQPQPLIGAQHGPRPSQVKSSQVKHPVQPQRLLSTPKTHWPSRRSCSTISKGSAMPVRPQRTSQATHVCLRHLSHRQPDTCQWGIAAAMPSWRIIRTPKACCSFVR